MRKKPKIIFHKNRDGMWSFMRKYKVFNIAEIALELDMHHTSVKEYVLMLLRGGFIELHEKGHSGVAGDTYRLVRNVGHHRPELEKDGTVATPSGNQKMWMAMKALKIFNHKDVSLSAMVPHVAAKSYCVALLKAGYLTVHKKAVPNGSPAQYLFNKKMDSGFYAPMIKRMKVIYDRNLNKVVWTPPESEAA